MVFYPQKMIVLDTVDSTNNYAMGGIQSGALKHGNAVFAIEQTAGKGRRGRQWLSQPGANIILSVIAEMQWLPLSRQFHLSAAAALACRDLVAQYTSEKVSIKWPNDIFINDSKAGGLLIETVVSGTLWQWAVIGIGVNVNQREFEDTPGRATSLYKVNGSELDVLSLASTLHEKVILRLQDLHDKGFDKMLSAYNQHLYARGRRVKLSKGNIAFETTIEEVDSQGVLHTRDVIDRSFNMDEVIFRKVLD